MIEGVLRHCTEMEIERQYVDSHGQSEVAFAFCHLLGFALLPRLKTHPCHGSITRAGEPVRTRTCPRADAADRLGADPAAVRRDGEVRDGASPRHRRPEAILRRFTREQRPAPHLQGAGRVGRPSGRSFCAVTCIEGAPAGNPRGPERGRDLEQRQWVHLLRQGRRDRD